MPKLFFSHFNRKINNLPQMYSRWRLSKLDLHRKRLAGSQRSAGQADRNREDAGGRHEVRQLRAAATTTTATTTTTISVPRFKRAKWTIKVYILNKSD